MVRWFLDDSSLEGSYPRECQMTIGIKQLPICSCKMKVHRSGALPQILACFSPGFCYSRASTTNTSSNDWLRVSVLPAGSYGQSNPIRLESTTSGCSSGEPPVGSLAKLLQVRSARSGSFSCHVRVTHLCTGVFPPLQFSRWPD